MIFATPQAAWRHLHELPTTLAAWNPETAFGAYLEWLRGVGTWGDCECRDHFAVITAYHPPRFSTRLEFAFWSWFVHDEVSCGLTRRGRNHPCLSWHDCCREYRYPTSWRSAGCGSSQHSIIVT